MKRFAVLFFSFLFIFPVYSLEWISLHEKADRYSSASAKNIAERTNVSDDWYVFALVSLNEYKENDAEAGFNKVLALDPASVEGRWGVAEVKRRRHEEASAKKELQDIIRMNDQFFPAYLSLAYIYFNEGNFQDTVRLMGFVLNHGREKIDIDNYARAHLLFAGAKGMIAHRGGPVVKLIHGTQVLPNIKRAQKLLPNSAMAYFGLGAFYLLAPSIAGGDLDKAEEALLAAIKADPKLADAYVRLAQAYKAKGDEAKYNYYLEKALAIDPKNVLANDIKSKTCRFICIDAKE